MAKPTSLARFGMGVLALSMLCLLVTTADARRGGHSYKHYRQKQKSCTWELQHEGSPVPFVPLAPISERKTALSFYRYTFPELLSSNTGLEKKDTLQFLVYKNEKTDAESLVVMIDKPRDGSGGTLKLNMTSSRELPLIFKDDPWDAIDFVWSIGTTPRQSSWKWDPCCTDGGIWSFLERNDDVCIEINVVESTGLEHMKVLSQGHGGEVDAIDLPLMDSFKLCRLCLTPYHPFTNRVSPVGTWIPRDSTSKQCLFGGETFTVTEDEDKFTLVVDNNPALTFTAPLTDYYGKVHFTAGPCNGILTMDRFDVQKRSVTLECDMNGEPCVAHLDSTSSC